MRLNIRNINNSKLLSKTFYLFSEKIWRTFDTVFVTLVKKK